jgi:hypothetical protein
MINVHCSVFAQELEKHSISLDLKFTILDVRDGDKLQRIDLKVPFSSLLIPGDRVS